MQEDPKPKVVNDKMTHNSVKVNNEMQKKTSDAKLVNPKPVTNNIEVPGVVRLPSPRQNTGVKKRRSPMKKQTASFILKAASPLKSRACDIPVVATDEHHNNKQQSPNSHVKSNKSTGVDDGWVDIEPDPRLPPLPPPKTPIRPRLECLKRPLQHTPSPEKDVMTLRKRVLRASAGKLKSGRAGTLGLRGKLGMKVLHGRLKEAAERKSARRIVTFRLPDDPNSTVRNLSDSFKMHSESCLDSPQPNTVKEKGDPRTAEYWMERAKRHELQGDFSSAFGCYVSGVQSKAEPAQTLINEMRSFERRAEIAMLGKEKSPVALSNSSFIIEDLNSPFLDQKNSTSLYTSTPAQDKEDSSDESVDDIISFNNQYTANNNASNSNKMEREQIEKMKKPVRASRRASHAVQTIAHSLAKLALEESPRRKPKRRRKTEGCTSNKEWTDDEIQLETSGFVTVLTPVRAPPQVKEELGVENVITQVRRSMRTKEAASSDVEQRQVQELLNKFGYAYVPNRTLSLAAARHHNN